jgi:hypothetical protein
MKIKSIFYFFCFTSSICAMHNDIITHAMVSAMENDKITEFPKFVDHIREQKLINKKENLGPGLIDLGSAAAVIVLLAYINLEQPHYFIKNEVRLSNASMLMSRGIEKMHSALSNKDKYKKLAIKLLLHKVRMKK